METTPSRYCSAQVRALVALPQLPKEITRPGWELRIEEGHVVALRLGEALVGDTTWTYGDRLPESLRTWKPTPPVRVVKTPAMWWDHQPYNDDYSGVAYATPEEVREELQRALESL